MKITNKNLLANKNKNQIQLNKFACILFLQTCKAGQ